MLYSVDGNNGWASKLKPNAKNAVVVTPSIASRFLHAAMDSVSNQETDYEYHHLIVWDGPIHNPIKFETKDHMAFMTLPWNVGRHGFYGHRVYAAIGHLVNADAVFFLDEDNTFEPNHIQTCMDKLNETESDFVFSYRNVIDEKGDHICRDRFEAIGDNPINLVDTSSYCIRTNFLTKYGHLWHHGWGADRRFFQIMKNTQCKYTSTGAFTLNYRLDGNPNSPTKDFFHAGNERAGYTREGL